MASPPIAAQISAVAISTMLEDLNLFNTHTARHQVAQRIFA